MADLLHQWLQVTNLASSSGACRIQILMGHLTNGYGTLITDLELTAAQNAALSTALAAAATTVTTLEFAQAAAPLPGISNAI